ncbi:unnamed protein product [Paramecium sonneborni]|uniref:Uncharacterized protein n=1 Tax=Paramecium sonneborni TaxID=65129 RepID=A0A8S1JU29_9CILI|nr:unnamed protein product [Paramecium sonneborni]
MKEFVKENFLKLQSLSIKISNINFQMELKYTFIQILILLKLNYLCKLSINNNRSSILAINAWMLNLLMIELKNIVLTKEKKRFVIPMVLNKQQIMMGLRNKNTQW